MSETMTAEQAASKLTNIMHDDHYSWHPSILTAFGMAVDALRELSSAQPSFPQVHENDAISRQAAIDAIRDNESENYITINNLIDKDVAVALLENLPSAQPETYKEKLNEIASALSEKFAYMNTCLNERDIILGYLGVKRSCETHCNTDCTNTKCESHPLSSTQAESCEGCKHLGKWENEVEYGYPSPCTRCKRRVEDHYEK